MSIKQRLIDEANAAHKTVGSGVTVSDLDVEQQYHVVAFMTAVSKRIAALEKAAAEKQHGGAINTTPFNDQGQVEYLEGIADRYIDITTIDDNGRTIRIKV